MATWEPPELTSSHGHIESTATHKTISSERNPEIKLETSPHQARIPISPTSNGKEMLTYTLHKPHPHQSIIQLGLASP